MFTYDHLESRTSNIRLVRFKQPAPVDLAAAPIELELRHASFDEDTHYTALSYVWGRPDTRTAAQVHINGYSFTIGSNLHVALTQLYRNGVRSWLWVDSICINQSDMEEKSVQVAQMRNIFSWADRVYIWLGPGSTETAKALDFAIRVGPRALDVGVLDLWSNEPLFVGAVQDTNTQATLFEMRDRNNKRYILARELSDFILDILREPDLQLKPLEENRSSRKRRERRWGDLPSKLEECNLARGIKELMESEYWHRVWIIQEVALAGDSTVLCGDRTIPLAVFDAAFSAVSFCKRLFQDRLHPDFAWGVGFLFYSNVALSTRRKLRGQNQSEKIQLVSILFQKRPAPNRPHYSATDARDIVFGLLGVATDAEALGLRVDYNMTLAEVFTVLTRALIYDEDKNRPAYHLDDCVPRQREESSDALPSWVPDWRAIGRYGIKVHSINVDKDFNATAGIPIPLRPKNCSEDDTRGLLRCSGCCVDVVTDVMKPPPLYEEDEWSVGFVLNANAWLDSVCDFAKLGPEPGPGEDYVWRTIMRDSYDYLSGCKSFEAVPIDEEKASIIRRIMRRLPIVVESLTEAQRDYIRDGPYNWHKFDTLEQKLELVQKEWPNCFGNSNRGRTLFKTTKGMFGLAHTAIQRGDIISLLWGVGSPIILRPRDDEASGGFTFVGDAYVDGIMYGEFLKTAPAHTDFKIY